MTHHIQKNHVPVNNEFQEIFQTLYNSNHETLFVHDLTGRFIDINTPLIKEIGYTKQELLAKTVRDLLPETDKSEFDSYLMRIISSKFERGTFTIQGKTGTPFIFEYINYLVRGEDGPVAVRGLARNISDLVEARKELKKNKEKLKESEQKFRDIFENISSYIYIHDLNGKYIDINPYFKQKTGYSQKELESKNLRDRTLSKMSFTTI